MMKFESKKRKIGVYLPLSLVIIVVLVAAVIWYRDYTQFLTTDDARIDADNVNIGSKVLGRVVSVNFGEGDSVNSGDLLASLDSSDLVAQRNQSLAMKAQAMANLNQAEVKLKSDQKGIKVLEINYEKASEDFKRAKNQSEGGVITNEQFDHSKKAYEAAAAQLETAKSQLGVSKAVIGGASASVETAQSQVNVLNTQLHNMSIIAPSNGIIAKRWLLPGDIVSPGQSLFTLTLNNKLWVIAYIEETKIGEIHDGQEARFTVDAFDGITFTGKVFLKGVSTASLFSLIPANNASGNFTKVTQRIPVRISIDGALDGSDLSRFEILPGMSAVVKIKKD